MTDHRLKTWPEFYDAIQSGDKTFEVRVEDDRTFAVGDTLTLLEYDPVSASYTQRTCRAVVSYIWRTPHETGRYDLCVMALRDVTVST